MTGVYLIGWLGLSFVCLVWFLVLSFLECFWFWCGVLFGWFGLFILFFFFNYCGKRAGQRSKSSPFWWWQVVISGLLSLRPQPNTGDEPLKPSGMQLLLGCPENVFIWHVLPRSPESSNSWPLIKGEKRVSAMQVRWWHFPGLLQKSLPLWLSPMPKFLKTLI